MRLGRAPSRELSGSGGPQWDDPNGQLPGTGIPGDGGDSLYRSSSLRRRRFFFLLYAAWVRSRAESPSVSYTKVVMEVAWTGHNLQFTKTAALGEEGMLWKVLVKRVLESFQNDPVCFRLQEVLLSIHFQQLYLL